MSVQVVWCSRLVPLEFRVGRRDPTSAFDSGQSDCLDYVYVPDIPPECPIITLLALNFQQPGVGCMNALFVHPTMLMKT